MGIRIAGYELDEIRKAVVTAGLEVAAIATVALDTLADSDLSTPGGVIAAVIALATPYAVFKTGNARR